MRDLDVHVVQCTIPLYGSGGSVCRPSNPCLPIACMIVGPALAAMDWIYLSTAMKNGLLNGLGGLSVHPYR